MWLTAHLGMLSIFLINWTTANGLTVYGKNSMNAKLGGSAKVTWKIQDNKDNHASFQIYVNTINDMNKLFQAYSVISKNFSMNRIVNSTNEVLNRSSANYKYTGNQSGNYTGEITLTINNLKSNDEGPYILRNQGTEIIRTNLAVNLHSTIKPTPSGANVKIYDGICVKCIIGVVIGVIIVGLFSE